MAHRSRRPRYARPEMGDSLTPEQIVLVIALVFALAIACQVVAPRLHVPGLLLLLPAGFLLGMAFPALNLEDLLGSAFGWWPSSCSRAGSSWAGRRAIAGIAFR